MLNQMKFLVLSKYNYLLNNLIRGIICLLILLTIAGLKNHPEFSTTDLASFSDDVEPTIGTSLNFTGLIADEFSYIELLVPLSIEQLSETPQEPLIDNVDLSAEAVTSQQTSSEILYSNALTKRISPHQILQL